MDSASPEVTSLQRRIYVQLQPSPLSISMLLHWQGRLLPQTAGRALPPEELHLTLLHIGRLTTLFETYGKPARIPVDTFIQAIRAFVERTEQSLHRVTPTLVSQGFQLLGPKRTVAVMVFASSPLLDTVHTEVVQHYQRFFADLGIPEPNELTEFTPFLPHVTLYKGFRGELPTVRQELISFEPMSVVYRDQPPMSGGHE